MKHVKLRSEQGFTIVELMIALSVLSVLLITATLILIQIGALYSKGVNAADLQNVNRNVVSDLTGQLQFSGKVPAGCVPIANDVTCYVPSNPLSPSPTTIHNNTDGTDETIYSYCIGKTRYSYVMNRELGTDSGTTPTQVTQHVLWRDTMTSTSSCPPADIVNGTHLDDPPSSGDGYEMMGSHMRLTRFNIQPLAGSNGVYTVQAWMAFGDSDLVQTQSDGTSTCSSGKGTQFCAISTISTQVTGRVY
jgi:prepilin-type N-terminal cleavage/methylation domain-containing protein